MSRHQFNSLISLIPQSQLACDGFAISLLWFYRHFRPGVLEKNRACLKDTDYLRLLGHFWESGGHRVTFNSDLKPGAAFLIAIWSPINRSMPGRCLVGHRRIQILVHRDNPYISVRRRPDITGHPTGTLQIAVRPPYGM